jgi:hypothetical protein
MKFTSVGESLRRHWSSNNVEINAGVSEAVLTSFEKKYAVVLPEDLRDYFLCVDGMPPEIVDDGFIRFWTLEEVVPLPQGAPDYSNPQYIQGSDSIFLFADYSMWAHAYAIRLTKAPTESNEVFVIGRDLPSLISNSFSQFVDIYLTNKDQLLFPLRDSAR